MLMVLWLDLLEGHINIHCMAVQFQNSVLTSIFFPNKFSQLMSYRNTFRSVLSLWMCLCVCMHV